MPAGCTGTTCSYSGGLYSSNVYIGNSSLASGFALQARGYCNLQQVCFQAYSVPGTSISWPTSFLNSAYTPTAIYSQMPAGYSSYGLNTTGSYNGHIRAPVGGLYNVQCTTRFADNTSSVATGMILYAYNGSTSSGIFPSDGQIWAAPDNSGRRTCSCSTMIQLSQGWGVYPTAVSGAGSMVVQWTTLSMTLVYAT